MTRRTGRVEARIERAADQLVVHWSADGAGGSCRFDHLPGTAPEWLGSADELLEGADRRLEGRILTAVAELAAREGLRLGIWHNDAGVEEL